MRGPFIAIEDVWCAFTTEKAALCKIHGADVFVPLSQIHDDSEVFAKGTRGRLIVTEWIAKQKDIDMLGEVYEEEVK